MCNDGRLLLRALNGFERRANYLPNTKRQHIEHAVHDGAPTARLVSDFVDIGAPVLAVRLHALASWRAKFTLNDVAWRSWLHQHDVWVLFAACRHEHRATG